jgi:hypothetical protein
MNLVSAIKHKDFVRSVGTTVTIIFRFLLGAGTTAINIAKFLLYDVTIFLTRFPFGNWIGILYFATMLFVLKGECGEFNRLLGRAINLYFIQKKSVGECFDKFQFYLLQIFASRMTDLKRWTIDILWNRVGVQQFVKDYATTIVSENAEIIEKRITTAMESAAFASIVNTLSQKLIAELGPVLFETYMRQNAESTAHRTQLNQKMAEIAMQVEYLRLSQPDQFREILNTMSLSTLVLNDAAISSSSVVDIIAKWTGTFGSSASRQGRTRIENE